jgi:riboflavin kinase/FMN adenylyltransferase
METITKIENFTPTDKGCVLTIGIFDGLHHGHRAVINRAKETAQDSGRQLVLLTFAPGPREFFSGTDEGHYILTVEEFKSELASMGVDRLLVLPFVREFRELSAEDFLRDILRTRLNTKELVVGCDFTFGFGKKGNIDLIKSLGDDIDLKLITVGEVVIDGLPVRSTLLRELIRDGHIEKANSLLGFEFYVIGKVGPGQGIGGILNCPTANIVWPKSKVKPKRGVYMAKAVTDGREYPSAVNFGVRPTITGGSAEDRLEAHLIDFDGDLEGKEVVVKFIKFVRDEIEFPSMEELAQQIAKDITETRDFFGARKL